VGGASETCKMWMRRFGLIRVPPTSNDSLIGRLGSGEDDFGQAWDGVSARDGEAVGPTITGSGLTLSDEMPSVSRWAFQALRSAKQRSGCSFRRAITWVARARSRM